MVGLDILFLVVAIIAAIVLVFMVLLAINPKLRASIFGSNNRNISNNKTMKKIYDCPYCGAPNIEGNSSCFECGKSFK